MMKKYILLATASLALAACDTEDNYTDEPVAVQISANIETLSRASDVKWDAGDNIGIFMSGRSFNINYVTEKGDGMFTGNPIFFKNKQEPVTITAYYPYTGTEGETPDAVTASTGGERQTATEQSKYDFLYAVKENATGAEPNVNLTFKHMMSKLTILFENGNIGTDVTKITSCEINGLVLDGTFNPATGACAASAGTPAAPLKLTATQGVLPSLILFPQTVEKVTLKISDIENQDYSCELKFDGNRLESGNNYLYTIKVSKTGLNVDYSINNWTEKTDESEAMSE